MQLPLSTAQPSAPIAAKALGVPSTHFHITLNLVAISELLITKFLSNYTSRKEKKRK